MANVKGSAIRNVIYNGKQSMLPPKSPFPSISPSFVDYAPTNTVGNASINPRQGNAQHQRASSESQMEEQPSWLDELLNEPETPVRRSGHRRSSSDSFAYIDSMNGSSMDYVGQDGYKFKNMVSVPSWGSQDFDHYNVPQGSFYTDLYLLAEQKNWARESSVNSIAARPSGHLPIKENITVQTSSFISQEGDKISSSACEKQDPGETGPNDPRAASDKKDSQLPKCSASETDMKHAKQQFAQRSRVRKLQYIAELERNVQALQVEGSEVSAELEFLNQQNLILSMENKALKQRLESIAQEQLIKYMEHEVLEREIGRLRSLYQQQQHLHQPQQQPSSRHRRSNSQDLDAQFSNLSLKQKDASSGSDPIADSLHI